MLLSTPLKYFDKALRLPDWWMIYYKLRDLSNGAYVSIPFILLMRIVSIKEFVIDNKGSAIGSEKESDKEEITTKSPVDWVSEKK